MKKIHLLAFFLLFTLIACNKEEGPGKGFPDTRTIDALLARDTTTILLSFDSLSLEFMDVFYNIPFIKSVNNLHYRFVVSRMGKVLGKPVYRYTVIFPWKEEFTFLIVSKNNKWEWFPLFLINSDFSYLVSGNFYYFYPKYESGIRMSEHQVHLTRFKDKICTSTVGRCPSKVVYVYTEDLKPEFVYSLGKEDKPIYKRGLCVSNLPEDTLHLLHSLLDNKDYLFPFIRGIYYNYYGKHVSFGFDFGDWVKSSFASSSFRTIASDFVEDMVFYKPLASSLGYLFIRYLAEKKHLSRKEILRKNFVLTPIEKRIIVNNGSREVFIRKRVESITGTTYTKLIKNMVEFIKDRFSDISDKRDTIKISRDKKRNITFVKSSLYKNADEVESEFKEWLDSIPFFYHPYYNILLLPIWEVDSFRMYLTPANSYWVPAFEFKNKEEVLSEIRREYATNLISDFIRTFSIQESQLPLWFSLGLPMYLDCKDTCDISPAKVFEVGKGDAFSFYQQPVGRVMPQQGIILSYYLLKIIDAKHPGKIYELLERSMSNMTFKKTYREVTGSDIKEIFNGWKMFIEDTLYFRVSRK